MIQYKNYSLIDPNPDQVKQIERLIDDKDGSVFHDVFLNKHVSNSFDTKFFYLVDDENNIKNFSPIHQVKENNGLIRYQFKPLFDIPYAGFLSHEKIDINEIKSGFFEAFKYEGFPYYKSESTGNISDSNGLTSILDLRPPEDEIFENSINSKKRNKIRRAVKEGITVREFKSKEGMEVFWSILKPLHDKLGFNPNLDFDYYNDIYAHYSMLDKAFILIAYKNEVAISGVLILGNQNYMHYYKGASVFGFKNEGQGELLQWEAIKHCKKLGVKYYDLCNLNKEKLPGIYSFKTGICNHLIEYPIKSNNNLGFKILNRLKRS
jgi:hypothetical protein